MNILRSKPLKERAVSILSHSKPDYRKLVCFHAAVSIGASLILTLVDLLLGAAVVDTGGLAGRGIRAIFETIRSLLSSGISLVLPFWQVGILYTSIRVTRQQNVSIPLLTRGFNRLGPVLRYYLLLIAIVFGICMVSAYAAVPFAASTTVPPELKEAIQALDESVLEDPELLFASIPMDQMLLFLMPLFIPMLILCLGGMIYISYRFRLCPYLLLDDPQVGAIQAVSLSNRMTKGHKWCLFKLDISFWWYYLLQWVLSVIALLPVVLELFHVALPVPGAVLYLICQVIYSLGSLALTWLAGAYVEITYACAYDQLRIPPQQITIV